MRIRILVRAFKSCLREDGIIRSLNIGLLDMESKGMFIGQLDAAARYGRLLEVQGSINLAILTVQAGFTQYQRTLTR